MANLTSTLAIRLIDGVSGPAKGAAGAISSVGKATADLGKVRGFREHTARLNEMSQAHQRARDNVRSLANQLMAAENPSARLQAAYGRAAAAADKLGNKIEWQRARVRGAGSELERMGVSVSNLGAAEARLRTNIDAATAAMKRQEAASARSRVRRDAAGALVAGAGTIAAVRAASVAKKSVIAAADFDIGVRRQRAYAGISQEEQDKMLIPQAKRIGQDTQFSNLDIVEAQTAIMQRLPEQLPRAAVAQAITEEVKNYALSMRADMKTSAEGITAFLMQTGKDISTQDKAVAEARRASNMLIKMAKIGGMSDEDVSQFMKYAATSGTLAGLSNETLGALGVGLKRAGFRGDEAGVGVRTVSSKLVAPTRKGMDALSAMGVDYNKFTTMPGGLSPENLEAMQKRRFGKTFSDDQRTRLAGVMENPEVVANKDDFITQVSEIISESFDKRRDGKTKAQDAQKIAKLAADFHQLGIQSVDAEGLLSAILAAKPSLQQLNALFTDKQGGKAGALGKAFEQIGKDREALQTTPGDYGKKIADEIMGGLGGSLERLKGSVENLYQSMGEANAKVLSFTFDGIGSFIDGVSNMSGTARQAATALGAMGAAYGAYKGAGLLNSLVTAMRGGGSAAALSGSALALDGSAAALTRAAMALGAKGAGIPDLPGAPGAKKPSKLTGALGVLGRAVPYGAAAYGLYEGGNVIRDANQKRFENVAPGEVHNQGQMKRRAGNAAIHQQFLEQRKALEGGGRPGGGAPVGADKFGAAGVGTTVAAIEARIGALPEKGTEAGAQVSSNIAAGVAANSPQVDAQVTGIMARIKALFGMGVDVPVRLQPNGMPPAGGGASPAASSPAIPPAPAKSAAATGPTIGKIDVAVTATGSVQQVADAVSRAVGAKTAEAMRGSFSDSNLA